MTTTSMTRTLNPNNADAVDALTDPMFWHDNATRFNAGEMASLSHLLTIAGATDDALKDIWDTWAANDPDVTTSVTADGTTIHTDPDGEEYARFTPTNQ